jgi:hypothetical protein
MNNTVLQVPLTKDLRQKSEIAASKAGFSSLQEAVRLFLHQFCQEKISFSFNTPKIKLSPKNKIRYQKLLNDYKNDINITKTTSLEDFFAKLDE